MRKFGSISKSWLFSVVLPAGFVLAADLPVYELEDFVVNQAKDEARGSIVWNMPIEKGPSLLLSGENLRERQLFTVEDIFRQTPGVYVRSQFTGTSQARMIVRGFGVAGTPPTHGIRLLLDGMPMTLPDGHFLPQNVDLRTLEAAEVYRGSAELHSSAGALAGAVNYRTFTAENAPALRLRLEAGSYDNRRGHVAAAHAGETADIFAAATHASQKGHRPLTHEDAEFFSANAGQRIGDDMTLRVYALYSRVDGELAGPISLKQFEIEPASINPPGVNPNVGRDKPFRELEVSRLGAILHRTDGHTDTELAAWVLYSDYQVYRPRAKEGLDFVSTAPGLSLRHGWDADLAGRAHRFEIAGELYAEDRPTRRRQLNEGRKGSLQSDHDEKSGMATLALGDTVTLHPRWSLALTVMPEWHWRSVEENFNNAPKEVDYDETFFFPSARAQLNWKAAENIACWTAAGANFEPPILDDLVGSSASSKVVDGKTVKRLNGAKLSELDAQEAVTVELGARGQTDRTRWDVTLYRSRVNEEIIRTRPPEGPDRTLNAEGMTVHQGVESALEFDLLSMNADAPFGLTFLAVVNVNDFKFDGDPQFGDHRLPAVPVVMAQSELLARFAGGWYAGVGTEWAPDGMYVDFANTLKTDGYALAHARIGRQVSRSLSFYATLENAFDKDFVNSVAPQADLNDSVSAETSALFPGQGRRGQVGMEYAF